MSDNPGLKRSIGLLNLIAYYFSTVVGAGIFIVPIATAKKAGPASIISWLIALLSTIPFALIFAHISSRYKVSGCIQKFLEDSGGIKFGRSIALYLTSAAIIGNTLLAITASNYVLQLIGCSKGYSEVFLVSFLVILLPTIFNLFEIGVSSRIQTISIITLVVLVEMVVILSIPQADLGRIEPFAPFGTESIFAAAIICFYSVIGWENVDAMAGEVENPYMNYKKGIKYSIFVIAIFYLSIVITTILVLDVENMDSSTSIITQMLSISYGAEVSKVATLFSVVLLLLGLNAWTLGASRLIYALSRDKVISKRFSVINARSVPSRAILLQFICCILFSLLIMLFHLDIDYILELASVAYLILYTLIFFCGIKSFTTSRLKLLSLIAMTITVFFIYEEGSNDVMSVVSSLLLCCFMYVYFIAGKRFDVHMT